ncbi:molybdopterin-guanine dinucleotide biosynthesis protein B [Ornithinibacillus sp. L9]|uniref:Molybdopterin-guanine dinucleotide biosynthesis protein B n=1 Tax=Ornithinibacillus caprae TaxID=2678566 RepID=A0A6N8FPA0_9BACI|nr:molybdopterin-guanine dinucleotide biosynthesis protein B [Ornithinibacillus caprae]MUK90434.1 molybdopterin-guanine dinucleotide biosynthesis protein B [Ornithinibacillus caprae]
MEVIQVVGYKNSGKTTLSTKLIDFLTAKGIRVGSLKHHGHGGQPIGIESTDSEKHRRAGSVIAGVEGGGVLQLSNRNEWDVEQVVDLYRYFGVECLVVEGYKSYSYKKIVLIRHTDDLHVLDQVDNIIAVVSTIPLSGSGFSFPIYNREKVDELMEWIYLEWVSLAREEC